MHGVNVLKSDSGYLSPVAVATDPADSTTYYMGAFGNILGLTTTADISRLYFPQAGTVVSVSGFVLVSSVLGSSETMTLSFRLNDTTDTTITSTLTMDALQVAFSNNALSIAIAQNDYCELKVVTPAWVTNPTQVYMRALIALQV